MSVSKSARSVLLGSAFLATGLTSAWAEPATLQGAQQLTDVLARYVGHVLFDKGILTISPRGEGYDFTVEVDSRKLLPDVKGKSFHYGPKSLFAIPPADGTLTLDWQAVGQDFSGKTGPSLTLGEATGKIGDCNAHLVFDPRPAGSLSATGSCDSFAVKVPASTEDIDATIGKVTARVTMRPGSNGSTDSDADFQMHDLVERITLKVPDKAPEDIVVRMGKLQEGIALSGFQTSQYDTLNKFVLDNAKPGEPGGVGTAAISAAGLQGLIDAINQSPLPDKGKALLGLAFIKGLSKTNPEGRFTWNVDFDALAKKVTVNGQTFGPGPH